MLDAQQASQSSRSTPQPDTPLVEALLFASPKPGTRLPRFDNRAHRRELPQVLILVALMLAFFGGCATIALGGVAIARSLSTKFSVPFATDATGWHHR